MLALGTGRGVGCGPTRIFCVRREAIHQEPVFKASRKRVYEALDGMRISLRRLVELSAAMKGGMKLGDESGGD